MYHYGIDGAEKKRAEHRNKMDDNSRGCRSDQTQIGHDGKEYSAWSGNYVPPVSKEMFKVGIGFWVCFILLLLWLASKG